MVKFGSKEWRVNLQNSLHVACFSSVIVQYEALLKQSLFVNADQYKRQKIRFVVKAESRKCY